MKYVEAMKVVAVGGKAYKSVHGATDAICNYIMSNRYRRLAKKRAVAKAASATVTYDYGESEYENAREKAYRRVRPLVEPVYAQNKKRK